MSEKSTLPVDLVFVRHGESIGNLASRAYRRGDPDAYGEDFFGSPGCRWELTDKGREQAALAGQWVLNHLGDDFDRYYVSPYDRALETAELMGLPYPEWMVEDRLRERSNGDMQPVHPDDYEDTFRENLRSRVADPYYHRYPNGENYPDVVARLRDLFGTVARELPDGRVLMVTHGDTMNSAQMAIERIDSIRWHTEREQPHRKVWNCDVFQYTRRDPVSGELSKSMTHVRHIRPWRERRSGPNKGSLYLFDEPGEWREIQRFKYDNAGLRALRLSRS